MGACMVVAPVIGGGGQAAADSTTFATGTTSIEFSLDGVTNWQVAPTVSPHPAWSTIGGTQWVSVAPDRQGPAAGAVFRFTFSLPATFSAPSLSFQVLADNSAKISLNGTVIGSQPLCLNSDFNGAGSTISTADASLFHAGENTVTVVVDNGLLGGCATVANAMGLDFAATLSYATLPTSADQCKKGGWAAYGVFRNQGDCVSFVATKGTNPPGN